MSLIPEFDDDYGLLRANFLALSKSGDYQEQRAGWLNFLEAHKSFWVHGKALQEKYGAPYDPFGAAHT